MTVSWLASTYKGWFRGNVMLLETIVPLTAVSNVEIRVWVRREMNSWT